ncbi:hypothetical protein PV407_12475 [Paenibacillus sp. GYB003]
MSLPGGQTIFDFRMWASGSLIFSRDFVTRYIRTTAAKSAIRARFPAAFPANEAGKREIGQTAGGFFTGKGFEKDRRSLFRQRADPGLRLTNRYMLIGGKTVVFSV